MNINPTHGKGFFVWFATGFFGGLIALFIGYFIPQLYPQRATQQKL